MLFVILYHSQIYYMNDSSSSFIYTPFFLTFFFFLSGYTFGLGEFVARRKVEGVLRGIILPYFIFTTIIYMPKAIVRGQSTEIADMAAYILCGYASWFVAALAVAQLLFIAALRYVRSAVGIFSVAAVLLVAAALLKAHIPGPVPWYFLAGFVAFFYVASGYFYRKSERRVLTWLHSGAMLPISLAVYLAVVACDYRFAIGSEWRELPLVNMAVEVVKASAGIVMMLCISYNFPRISILQYIGRHSLIFYFLNGGVITVICLLINKYGVLAGRSVVELCVVMAATVAILYGASWLIMRFAPWMIGDRTAVNRIINKFKRDGRQQA